MDDLSELTRSLPPIIVVLGLLGASLAVWTMIVLRICRGLPVLRYEPRRRVPWRGLEVFIVFVVLELPLLTVLLMRFFSGPQADATKTTPPAEKVDVEHPIVDLLRADPSFGTWLLCGLVAVVVAPIAEECTYRLLLQGWLETRERRARRRSPALRRLIPGMGPVVLVSFLFALRHYRTASPPTDPDLARRAMVGYVVWSLATLGFALGLLRTRCGATAADLGFVRNKFAADVRLGLLAFAAVTAPILLLFLLLTRFVLPENVAADPIPLFLLALMLGLLYYRTHRIVPAIVIHMAFNATGMLLFWL